MTTTTSTDEVERTDDGRWIVVGGRRWRASDPDIPDAFRAELVAELMSARRAVKAARSADDERDLAAARRRVDDAKRALGERGRPWWEPATPRSTDARVRATILALARHRSPKTICPSDAARAVGGPGWRELLDDVRRVAGDLQSAGEIDARQRGERVDAVGARGPIRLRLAGIDD